MIKTRELKESNYRGIWFNGKTIRVALDSSKPITELEYPEFYDVKLTGKCEGKCPWCYMDSKETDEHYENSVDKILSYFGQMTENQRPFQVALGGGEPTSHPDFIEILKTFKELGIEPNYTTNGMWAKPYVSADDYAFQEGFKLLDATKDLCGGVAVSCHPQLKEYWERAANAYSLWEIKLNFHIIISDRESIDDFVEIYEKWKDKVDYFVLLPYGNQGRAPHKEIDWDYLVSKLPEDQRKLAFGANFYPYLLKGNHNIKVSLYEPEIMSKFLDLKDMKLYPSSFAVETALN
jgi:organic radical activating enzyme